MFEPHFFYILAFVFYSVAFGVHFFGLILNRSGLEVIAIRGIWAGFIFHLAGLALNVFGAKPFMLYDPSEAYAFLSFMIILFQLGISHKYRVSLLALFSLPLVLLMMLASHLASGGEEGRDLLTGYWLSLHVILTFIAYSAFAVAFVTGLGYLVQDRQLKSHHPGKLFRWMPPLGTLDEVNTRTLVLGFMLLTLGLLSGFFWAQVTGETFWLKDPKVIVAVITWILYAMLMFLRVTSRLRGRKVAIGSVFGFTLVLISFVGISHTVVQ